MHAIMANSSAEINAFRRGDVLPRPPRPQTEAEIVERWRGKEFDPLISIICHTYNHHEFIEDALNGFLMQDVAYPFEIIVHDDASSDGTREIIERYRSLYPSIIKPIYQKENQWSKGSRPRKFTIPRAKGRYIALCEGDDYWVSPEKLEKQLARFKPGISLIFHDAIRVRNGVCVDTSYFNEDCVPVRGYTPHEMVGVAKIPTASALFLAKPFRDVEHPDIVNGDHLIWSSLASEGSAVFLPECLSAYRHHPGGVWSSRSAIKKIRPTLRSKSVIFYSVPPRFKSAALRAYCGACIGLLNEVLSAGDMPEAIYVIKRLYGGTLRMFPFCKLKSRDNFKDLVVIIRYFTISLLRSLSRIRF